MKNRKLFFHLFLFLLPPLHPALAAAAVVKPLPLKSGSSVQPLTSNSGSAKVTFVAVGKPTMLKIHGTATSGPAADLKLEGAQLKGSVDFAMDTLDTGITTRTQHMKEKYLHVKEHPKAKLTLTDAPVDSGFASTLTNSGEKAFKGKLSLHGKEKEVTGVYTAKAGVVEAKFPITLSEFAIDIPSYLGVTVADKVDVSVELPLKKK